MIKYFATAFKITNENIILTTPLVLFLFLLSIYLGVAQNAPGTVVSAILLLATILFMINAFFAGWFYMVKRSVDLSKKDFIIDEDKAKASFVLIKEFPVGVGEYFFSFLGGFILYIVLMVVLSYASYKIGMHFIGNVGVSLLKLKVAVNSPAAMKALMSSLTSEQLAKLSAWNFIFVTIMLVSSFMTMFWPAQIVSGHKNPLSSFFTALKFTFRKFFPSVILFIYLSIINFLVSLFNTFAVVNQILYFISLLVYFYFVVYIVVLVFLYYDSENQPKFDYTITDESYNLEKNELTENNEPEDNSDSGSDSLGQDESGDSNSEGK